MFYKSDILPGSPLPFGASPKSNGVQFSIFSRNASKVFLLLFDNPEDSKPSREIEINKEYYKTGDVWHIFIKGLKAGQLYLYRMDGEYDTKKGYRFNPNVYLLDPYAKAITGNFNWNFRKAGAYNSIDDKLQDASTMPKCIVINDDFDWEDDKPLKIPLNETIIYETHIRGLTVHYSSKTSSPGTYKGVIEKISYFKKLGITALEFLPVTEFDTMENYRFHPETKKLLKNYWGYSPLLFFAPKGLYSYPLSFNKSQNLNELSTGQQVTDFKYMVKELHKNGIEVILDVVFNHTSEGNEEGPILSFKGIDNSIYYMLEKDKSKYKNYSGCGNTLNCNHPLVHNLIMDSLHYWVDEMHVDGFRFDLASILGRDQNGEIMENPPLLEAIAEDPVLRDIKIIAEAWDAGGAYQVGGFQNRWAEWNAKYRDDIRKFWKNDDDMMSHLATRITGSSDLYHHNNRTPLHSINFITSHDGFTLKDLVSYNNKNNLNNGEYNKDGTDYNFSYNYGVEGKTNDEKIEFIRTKQIKNFFATLFLSQGIPMILGGDEFARVQNGNNNAYCQDNEISWYNWELLDKNKELFEFTRKLIQLRKNHPTFRRGTFFTGKTLPSTHIRDIEWYNKEGKNYDWSSQEKLLGVLISGNKYYIRREKDDNDFFIMFNPSIQDIESLIPSLINNKRWHLVIDTSKPIGEDIILDKTVQKKVIKKYLVKERSLVVLMSNY